MNKKINILIVEDEAITAESLKTILIKLNYNVIATVFSASEAIDVLLNNQIDLALLDINIQGDKNGIWLAAYINRLYKFPFIFLTAYGDKKTILEATKTKPCGYLLKPFTKADILASIEIALINYSRNEAATIKLDNNKEQALKENETLITNKTFFIKSNNSFIKLNIRDIIYFDSQKNYVTIFTDSEQFLVRNTLKDMLHLMPKNFVKIHRSFIVNIDKIDKITQLNIKCGSYILPLSNSCKSYLFEQINLLK